jgi:hypothetical protein
VLGTLNGSSLVLSLAETGEPAEIPVSRITEAAYPPDTKVYNLLLESGHTYWAEGLAVHDVFPDLGSYPRVFKLLKELWRSAEELEAALRQTEPDQVDIARSDSFYWSAARRIEERFISGLEELVETSTRGTTLVGRSR